MRLRSAGFLLSFIAMSIAMGAAWAGYMVVTPSNMQGTVLTTVNSASAQIQDPIPPGATFPTGALYMAMGQSGSCSTCNYSGQVWLGTNAYNGVALADISQLSYEAWCSNNGVYKTSDQSWSPPRQPCGLRLVINTNDPLDPTPIRMLIFRPLKDGPPNQAVGYGYAPYPENFDHLNIWKSWDCLYGSASTWAEFTYNVTPCLWTGPWLGTEIEPGVLQKYPNATIATPALQPPGGQWPPAYPVDTPNGCGLSLQWGAETMKNGTQPDQPWNNWWRDAWDGVGFVDYLQVGVGANLDTYDIEAETHNDPVVTNHVGFQHKVMRTSCRSWPYVVYGKAVEGTMLNAKNDENHIYLNDGGGQLEVVCPGQYPGFITDGNHYRVLGKALLRYGMQPRGTEPMRIHSDVSNVLELVQTPPPPP